MSQILFDLKKDYSSKVFPEMISKSIFEQLPNKQCKFCSGDLNPIRAEYYQHSGGWEINIVKQKIWIWFTCTKCRHQWSLNHLGMKRNQLIII